MSEENMGAISSKKLNVEQIIYNLLDKDGKSYIRVDIDVDKHNKFNAVLKRGVCPEANE